MIVLFLFQHAVGHLPNQLPVIRMLDGEESGAMRQGQGDHSLPLGSRHRHVAHKELEAFLVGEKVQQSLPLVGGKGRLPQERLPVASKILDVHPLGHHGKGRHAP